MNRQQSVPLTQPSCQHHPSFNIERNALNYEHHHSNAVAIQVVVVVEAIYFVAWAKKESFMTEKFQSNDLGFSIDETTTILMIFKLRYAKRFTD